MQHADAEGFNGGMRDEFLNANLEWESVALAHVRLKFEADSKSPKTPCGVPDNCGSAEELVGVNAHLQAYGKRPSGFHHDSRCTHVEHVTSDHSSVLAAMVFIR